MKHDFADGKYTVINDNGKLTALRHGEPWARSLVGDNLIYWMLVEVDELKTQRNELLEALKHIKHLMRAKDSEVYSIAFDTIAKATGAT